MFNSNAVFNRACSVDNLYKYVVQVAFEIYSIGEIDTLQETFQAKVKIESQWTTYEKIDNEYDPNVHWNPGLYIDNAFNVKESTSYEMTDEDDANVVTETRHVYGTFWERLDLENFPFDVQELELILTSKWSADKVFLVTDPRKLTYISFEAKNRFKDQQKWHLYRFVTTSDLTVYESEKIQNSKRKKAESISEIISARARFRPPKLIASVYSARKPGFYIINAFFLIFLITLTSFSVFSIDLKAPHFRLQSMFTILLSAISLKWSILKRLPSISYLTLLDLYQISSIFFICLIIAWHAIQATFFHTANMDMTVMVFFMVLFFLAHILFIFWVYRINKKQRKLTKKESLYFSKYKEQFMSQELCA